MPLTVVSTPIGNLGDLPPRAVETLRDADVVLAEDTRRTGRLLAAHDVRTPMRSYHEHNEERRTPEILERLGRGEAVALVTDAGTPAVSDPGYRLVAAAAADGHAVSVVPGASAALAALVVSGLPTDRFVVEGFLPRRGAARTARLAELAREPRTSVLFLSPHRAAADLADLADALGAARPAALARELTKLHEEVRRGPLGALAEHAAADGLRGEVTLVVAGAPADAPSAVGDDAVAAAMARRLEGGASRRDAAAAVAAELGVTRNRAYDVSLR